MPESWRQLGATVFIGNDLAAWTRAAIVFTVWFLVLPFAKLLVTRRLHALRPEQARGPLELLLTLLRRTTRLFLFAVATYLALKSLRIPAHIDRGIDAGILLIFWVQVALWGTAAVRHFIERRATSAGADLVPTLGILRFVGLLLVWVIALLMLLANLGVDITALVAGLGVGGVAVALALQTVLGDLFASLAIALDKPFTVGDTLQLDELVGTVEHIGIKSTRLRSVGGEEIVISNAQLLSTRLRNFGRAEERRILCLIGVTYETPPDKLRAIPEIVRGIVETLPDSRFLRCYFKNFGPSALEFEITFYSLSNDVARLVDLQQRFNYALVDAFAAAGISFAYPTTRQIVEHASPPAALRGSA
jgi:small-conductance mechanosensitive channel